MFRIYEKDVKASTRASARKRKNFDPGACGCFALVLFQGCFHGEIRTLALAACFCACSVLASLVKTGLKTQSERGVRYKSPASDQIESIFAATKDVSLQL